MTQRIFKKSCKQDMIDLWDIISDKIDFIFVLGKQTDIYYREIYFSDRNKQRTIEDRFHGVSNSLENNSLILNIDFETDKVEEMIINRSDYES